MGWNGFQILVPKKMHRIETFVNKLMTSNCYVVCDENYRNSIIIDPGTEKCEEAISFMDSKGLHPEYIILTHEHTDHTWGCNFLIDRYNSKVVCSQKCKEALPKEGSMYFQLYLDRTDYEYAVKRVDIVLEDLNYSLDWNGCQIKFFATPGHSEGSVCLSIDDCLFTGDTVMLYKPFIPKKNGSLEKFRESIDRIINLFCLSNTRIFPGHGAPFYLSDSNIQNL
jgi:hydroxyacylglutathione hydrolase